MQPLWPILVSLTLMAAAQRGAAAEANLRALASDGADGPSTTLQQAQIDARIARRITEFKRSGKIAAFEVTEGGGGLQWPLQPAPGYAAYGYYGTSGFPDHDPRFPDLVHDYTCGTRTYDLATGYNHHGTDYYLWPFPWRMMDLGQVHIVAAAPGVIVEKIGNFSDRSCANVGNTGFNAVYVRQDDGLLARYLHMKRASLTTRRIGDRVAAGDFLGLVGSSGPSSGPHLHFELQDAGGNIVDPHHGQCNDAPDLWAVFRPYEVPRIAMLTTHSAEPELVDCGVENGVDVREEPHFEDRFAPGATLWVFAAYSDHRNGDVTAFRILRPDGSVFSEWSFDLASEELPRPFYSGTAWDWSHTLPADAPTGVWLVRAEFADTEYEHAFEVVGAPPTRGHSRHARPHTR